MDENASGMDASLSTLERDYRIYQLHLQGYSHRAIASKLGLAKTQCTRAITRCKAEYAEQHQAARDEWVQLAVEKLQEVQRRAWESYEQSLGKDVTALRAVMDAEEKIAKLRGIYQEDSGQKDLKLTVEYVKDWRTMGGIQDDRSEPS